MLKEVQSGPLAYSPFKPPHIQAIVANHWGIYLVTVNSRTLRKFLCNYTGFPLDYSPQFITLGGIYPAYKKMMN